MTTAHRRTALRRSWTLCHPAATDAAFVRRPLVSVRPAAHTLPRLRLQEGPPSGRSSMDSDGSDSEADAGYSNDDCSDCEDCREQQPGRRSIDGAVAQPAGTNAASTSANGGDRSSTDATRGSEVVDPALARRQVLHVACRPKWLCQSHRAAHHADPHAVTIVVLTPMTLLLRLHCLYPRR
jgi:hypothetical protein